MFIYFLDPVWSRFVILGMRILKLQSQTFLPSDSTSIKVIRHYFFLYFKNWAIVYPSPNSAARHFYLQWMDTPWRAEAWEIDGQVWHQLVTPPNVHHGHVNADIWRRMVVVVLVFGCWKVWKILNTKLWRFFSDHHHIPLRLSCGAAWTDTKENKNIFL